MDTDAIGILVSHRELERLVVGAKGIASAFESECAVDTGIVGAGDRQGISSTGVDVTSVVYWARYVDDTIVPANKFVNRSVLWCWFGEDCRGLKAYHEEGKHGGCLSVLPHFERCIYPFQSSGRSRGCVEELVCMNMDREASRSSHTLSVYTIVMYGGWYAGTSREAKPQHPGVHMMKSASEHHPTVRTEAKAAMRVSHA